MTNTKSLRLGEVNRAGPGLALALVLVLVLVLVGVLVLALALALAQPLALVLRDRLWVSFTSFPSAIIIICIVGAFDPAHHVWNAGKECLEGEVGIGQ